MLPWFLEVRTLLLLTVRRVCHPCIAKCWKAGHMLTWMLNPNKSHKADLQTCRGSKEAASAHLNASIVDSNACTLRRPASCARSFNLSIDLPL